MSGKTYMCAFCGKENSRISSHVNRSRRRANPLFCDRKCFGLSRRQNKSDAQKREEKRLYDIEYRSKNLVKITAYKIDYFRRTYDPVKAAVERKKRSAAHAEYCRRPEYRAWKKSYDRQHRARMHYGEFWECFLLTQDLRTECLKQMSDYEIRLIKGTLTKSQRRKRDYAQTTDGQKPEIGPLGNLE